MAPVFDGEPGSACLIADSGEVLASAGSLPDEGAWVEAMAAIRRDAERAARHMGFAAWDALVIESEQGTIGVAPAGAEDTEMLAVVGCPGDPPPGQVPRALRRLATVVAARLNGGTLTREP